LEGCSLNEIIDKYLKEIQYNEEDLRPHHGVSAVIRKGNKILMMDHVKFNFWTIPVGKVEQGQSVEDGLKKEIKEELNITPTRYKEIGQFVRFYPRKGKKVKVEAHIFLIENWKGTIRNNEPQKHRSIKYMTIPEIKKLKKISDATKEMLKIIERK
jgi:ADP-ribose pyrophosphatase YjhB (NUDIX family)